MKVLSNTFPHSVTND